MALIKDMPEEVCRNELRFWKVRDYTWPDFAPNCFKQYTTQKKKAIAIATEHGFDDEVTRVLVADFEKEGLLKMRAALEQIVRHRLQANDARR